MTRVGFVVRCHGSIVAQHFMVPTRRTAICDTYSVSNSAVEWRHDAVATARIGRLAQLARASPLQGEGRGFKSLNAHHLRGQLVSGHVAPRQGGRNRHPDLIRGEEQSHQQ